jgi:hypothetical protein
MPSKRDDRCPLHGAARTITPYGKSLQNLTVIPIEGSKEQLAVGTTKQAKKI